MIRISHLCVHNIGPFEDTTFEFTPKYGQPDIHIFTGINGSGKTTLLHILAGVLDSIESRTEIFPTVLDNTDNSKKHNESLQQIIDNINDSNTHKAYNSNNLSKRYRFFDNQKNEQGRSRKSVAHAKLGTFLSNGQNQDIFSVHQYACEGCLRLHQTLSKSEKSELEDFDFDLFYKDFYEYQKALLSKNSIENYSLKFAAFAYSGYRLVTNGKIQIEEEDNDNPLHLALEFVKDKDTGNKLSNWIISRYSKAAIEEVQGNKETADRYRAALNCLINSLNELTGGEFKFEIKTNPWKVAINYYGKDVSFDVLPDGLRSLLSWMGDLLMRLDKISWEDKSIPVNEQNIILFLDEIEVHLHPKWQYEILPLTHKIFPNAQIFVSTHSPFVLNSIDNAKIYKLKTEKGISTFDGEPILTSTGHSYSYIYENILETLNRFGPETTKDLKRFHEIDGELVQGNTQNESEFQNIVERLLAEGEEVTVAISSKLMRLKRITGKNYYNGKDK